MTKFATLLVFLVPLNIQAAKWDFFTLETLYMNPIAYPRSPEFGLSLLSLKDKNINVALGKDFGLATLSVGGYHFQFGLEAAAWLTLGYIDENFSFPVVAEDFSYSIPISVRRKHTTVAVKYNHISAHLGDGANKILKHRTPIVYSRDFISFHVSHEFVLWKFKNRVYGHMGVGHFTIPEGISGSYLGGGYEIVLCRKAFSPYFAADTTYNHDVQLFTVSSQIGMWLARFVPTDFSLRVALVGQFGGDRRGQFVGERVNSFGIGVFIR